MRQVGTTSGLPAGERTVTKVGVAPPTRATAHSGPRDRAQQLRAALRSQVGDQDVMVVNNKNTIYALSPKCPHLGLPMKTGEITVRDEPTILVCCLPRRPARGALSLHPRAGRWLGPVHYLQVPRIQVQARGRLLRRVVRVSDGHPRHEVPRQHRRQRRRRQELPRHCLRRPGGPTIPISERRGALLLSRLCPARPTPRSTCAPMLDGRVQVTDGNIIVDPSKTGKSGASA